MVGKELSSRHTFGTFLRLFIHETPLIKLDSIIYMDIDVIFLSNLRELWNERNTTKFVQWGESRCAGLMIMNPKLTKGFAMEEIKNSINAAKTRRKKKFPFGVDDQQILTQLEVDHPEMFGILDGRFDIHLNNGKQDLGEHGLVTMNEVAFLHMNGGGDSPGAFFNYKPNDWKHLKKIDWINGKGWNLVKFYVDLPWSWLLSIEQSKVAGLGRTGKYLVPTEWRRHREDNNRLNGTNETVNNN